MNNTIEALNKRATILTNQIVFKAVWICMLFITFLIAIFNSGKSVEFIADYIKLLLKTVEKYENEK